MKPPTDPEEPLTHGGPERGYRTCKCSKCGTVQKCTPHFDFYTLGGDDLGPLHCEYCFWDHARNTVASVGEKVIEKDKSVNQPVNQPTAGKAENKNTESSVSK